MAIEVLCEGCGSTSRVKDELAGKRIKCKSCGDPVRVPHPDEEFASAPPPRSTRAPRASRKSARPAGGSATLPIAIFAVVIGVLAVGGGAWWFLRKPAGIVAGPDAQAGGLSDAERRAGNFALKSDVPVPRDWQLVELDEIGVALAAPAPLRRHEPDDKGRRQFSLSGPTSTFNVILTPVSDEFAGDANRQIESLIGKLGGDPAMVVSTPTRISLQGRNGFEVRATRDRFTSVSRYFALPGQVLLVGMGFMQQESAAERDQFFNSIRLIGEAKPPGAVSPPTAEPKPPGTYAMTSEVPVPEGWQLAEIPEYGIALAVPKPLVEARHLSGKPSYSLSENEWWFGVVLVEMQTAIGGRDGALKAIVDNGAANPFHKYPSPPVKLQLQGRHGREMILLPKEDKGASVPQFGRMYEINGWLVSFSFNPKVTGGGDAERKKIFDSIRFVAEPTPKRRAPPTSQP